MCTSTSHPLTCPRTRSLTPSHSGEFKAKFEEAQLGYYETYTDPRDLSLKVIDALETDLTAFGEAPAPKTPAEVVLRVTFEERTPPEQQPALIPSIHSTETSRSLHQMAARRAAEPVRQLLISNTGEVDAEKVQVKLVPPPGVSVSVRHTDDDGWTFPRDLTVDSVFALELVHRRTRPTNVDVMTRWVEADKIQEKTFTTHVY